MTDVDGRVIPIDVVLIGCGQVAAMHALHLRASKRARLVAVVDVNLEAATAFARKHGIAHAFASLQEALRQVPLQAAHIATPPSSHESIARACLEHGLHVLIEKPVVFSEAVARELLGLAHARGLLFVPDFNLLFHPNYLELKSWIGRGAIGTVLGVDLVFHNGFDSAALKEATSPPWAFGLPGGFLHNYLSHPLYLAHDLIGSIRDISVIYTSNGTLPQNLVDGLLIQAEGKGCSATIRLSLATRLTPLNVTVYGTRGTARVEFPSFLSQLQTTSRLPASMARIINPISSSLGTIGSTLRTVYRFLRGKLVPYEGLKNLIESFYAAAAGAGTAPVSAEMTAEVTGLEERIIEQGPSWALDLKDEIAFEPPPDRTVLVTGASGYLGERVVAQLKASGWHVRALVRFQSRVEPLRRLGADLIIGDAVDIQDVRRAAAGCRGIIHMAAAMSGTRDHVIRASTVGTSNVVQVAREHQFRRNIHISSFSVFDYRAVNATGRITEDSPLESEPAERSAYGEAKMRAEQIVAEANRASPDWMILRPSGIFGGGKPLPSLLGMKLGGRCLYFGKGAVPLRAVHVDDAASAIVHAWTTEAVPCGTSFNINHPDRVTLKKVGGMIRKATGLKPLFAGQLAGRFLGALTRLTFRLLKRGPRHSRRQVSYLFSPAEVEPSRLLGHGWRPAAPLAAQLEADLGTTAAKSGQPAS